MARQFKDRGSWHYGGAPAEGSTPHPGASDGDVASCFVQGVLNASDDPIKQYQVPSLSGSSIRTDICPSVWGANCKCP